MEIRKFLNALNKEVFPTILDIVVSGSGFGESYLGLQDEPDTILWDLSRAYYYQGYMDNILVAKDYDGVNVTGIFGWAIREFYPIASGKGLSLLTLSPS